MRSRAFERNRLSRRRVALFHPRPVWPSILSEPSGRVQPRGTRCHAGPEPTAHGRGMEPARKTVRAKKLCMIGSRGVVMIVGFRCVVAVGLYNGLNSITICVLLSMEKAS